MEVDAAAFDYDGTLAMDAIVSERALDGLRKLKASGRKLLLVTGRELVELLRIFPQEDLFERIVAENGGVVYCPQTGASRRMSEPPPKRLGDELWKRGVRPLSIGQVILATREPFQEVVLEVIRELGIEYHIIFNKGAVMILPSTVNKATGLKAALEEVGVRPERVAGIGDAENDHAFLSLCGFSAAVANALPSLKERVHLVTERPNGDGVVEFVEAVLVA